MAPGEARRFIGPHCLIFEPETGFFVFSQIGAIDEDHARGILEAFDALNPAATPPLVLADGSQATRISPAARQAFGLVRGATGPSAYVALYGGSFTFRAAANLLLTALKLAGQGVDGTMVPNEAQARAWLEKKSRTLGR